MKNINIMEFIQDKISALQNIDMQELSGKKDVVINIIIVVLTVFLIRFTVQKQTAQISKLRNNIEDKKVIIQLQNKIKEVKNEVAAYGKDLPVTRDYTDVINEVTNIARKNNIKITNIGQQQMRISDFTYDLPLTLSITGDYYDIWSFLRGIESSKELFSIESANVAGAPSVQKQAENTQINFCSANALIYSTSIKKD